MRRFELSTRTKMAVVLGAAVVTVAALVWTESRGPSRDRVRDWIVNYSRPLGVDPDLVEAMVAVESSRRPRAVSPKGAVGLMQLMPATARDMGHRVGIGDVDLEMLEDPKTNLRLGIEYLAWLRPRYDSLELTLAAYNAGPGRVAEWRRTFPDLDDRGLIEEAAFDETRGYVAKVIARYRALVDRREPAPPTEATSP